MEKIDLGNGKVLTIPSNISPSDRELLQKQISDQYGVDINAMTVLEKSAQLGKDLVQGIGQTTLDVPLGLAGLLDVGNDSQFVKNLQERKKYLAEDSIFANDPRMANSNLSALAQGLGSTVPFLGAGLAARGLAAQGLRKTAVATPFAFAAPTGVARQVELQQRAKDLGEEVGGGQEIFAELLGGAVGLTEALPIANLLRRTSKTALKDFGLKERIKSLAIGAGVEGSQEAVASLAQDLIARGVYSDELPIAESLMEEFMIGATVGGILDVALNTFAGRRGIANQSYFEQEKQLRENSDTLRQKKKYEKAIQQGLVEEIQPPPEVKQAPEIPVPAPQDFTLENRFLPFINLQPLRITDGSYILFDQNTEEEIGRFATEAEALIGKKKIINERKLNNVTAKIENILYTQGLLNSDTGFQMGLLAFDPNSTTFTASTIFNYNSKVPEKATAAQKEKLFAKFGLEKNKLYTMEEARAILPAKDFQLLQNNLADTVFKASEEADKPSIRNDKSEVSTSNRYIQAFAATKNIDLDLKSAAVLDYAFKLTGYSNIAKAPKSAKKLFLARLHSLDGFNVKTKLPDFRERDYTAQDMANFLSNAKAKDLEFSANDIRVASSTIMSGFDSSSSIAQADFFLQDLIDSGRVESTEGNKYKVKDNFEYDMARRAEGFNETVEEFENRLRSEGNLSEDAIQNLVAQERKRQEKFLPPQEIAPKLINFAQAVEEGKKTKFAKEVRKMLDGVGLKETGIVISDDILSTESLVETADGVILRDPTLVSEETSQYDAETDTIFVALGKINPEGNLTDAELEQKIMTEIDGQIVRALRNKDLFTEKEYQFLRQYVKRTKVPEGYDSQFKTSTFYNRSKSINSTRAENMQILEGLGKDAQEEMFVEEAIADLYKARPFLNNKPPRVEGIFNNIINFFKGLGQSMQRATIGNVDELLAKIEDGGVGLRDRNTIRTLKEVDRITLQDELRTGVNIGETQEEVFDDPDLTRTEDGELVISTPAGFTSTFSYYQDIKPQGIKGISMPIPVRVEETVAEPEPVKPPYDVNVLTPKELEAEKKLLLKNLQGKQLIPALEWVIKNAPSKDYELVAKKVLASLKATKKTVRRVFDQPDFDYEFIIDSFSNPQVLKDRYRVDYVKDNPRSLGVAFSGSVNTDLQSQAFFDRDTSVVLNLDTKESGESGITFDTFLHEAVHAATMIKIFTGKQAVKYRDSTPENLKAVKLHQDIEKMRKNLQSKAKAYIRENFDRFTNEGQKGIHAINYGLKNADEFLAMGLTDRYFQKFLESTKYTPRDKRNVWQKFTKAIRDALGIPPKLDTAFNQFLYLADIALDPDLLQVADDPRIVQGNLARASINNSRSLYQYIKDNPDGFTVDPDTLESPTLGYAVAPVKAAELILDADQITEAKVEEFIDTLQALSEISGVPVFAGGWFNSEDGKYYLDAVYNIDNKEDALYTAQAGEQIAIFDLGGQNEINTRQGIEELKETGRYSREAERQQTENTRKLIESFQKTRNRNQERLISPSSTFDRAKRYAKEPNTSENKKLIEATEKAEEIAKSSPVGFIPPYNTNASDVALKAALEFNEKDTVVNPKEVPHESGTIDPELEPLVDKVGYVDTDKTFFGRVSDSIGDIKNIRNAWSQFRVQFIDKLDAIDKKLSELAEDNDQIRAWNNNAVTSAIASLRLGDKARGIFQAMLNYGTPTDMIEGESSLVKVQSFEFDAKYNPFVEGNKGFGGFTQFTAPLYADPSVNREAIFSVYGGLKRKSKFDEQGREVETPFSQADLEKIDYIESNYPSVVEVYNNYQRWNNELIKLAESKGLLNKFKYRTNILEDMQKLVKDGRITEENLAVYDNLDDANLREVAERLGIDTRGTSQIWQDHSSYYPFYRRMIDENVQAPNIASGSLPNNPLGIRLEGSKEGFFVNPIEAIARNSLAILTASLKNDGAVKLMKAFQEGGIAEKLDSPKQAQGIDTITVFEDGRKVLYKVDDIQLYEGLMAVGGDSMGWFANIIARPASFLRDMVTRDPGFVVANLIRDTLSVAVTSGVRIGVDTEEGQFTPVYDTFKNMFGDMEDLEKFGIIGGYDFQNDEGSVKDFIRRSQRSQGLNAENSGKAEELFYKAWDGLGVLTTKSDGATRNAVFQAVYYDLKNRGVSEAQAQSEAAYQALEIINFGRRGLNPTFRIVTAAIPFLNARIQGLDVLGRTFTGKYSAVEKLEEGQSRDELKRQIFTRAALRGATLMGLTLIYYLAVSDTEEYKKARREERDDNWIIPTPIGRFLIPIPFEVGLLFKTFPERFIDEFIGRQVEKDPLESIRRGAATSLNVPFLQPAFGVQILKPLGEYMGNRNTFTGTEIVPYYQLQLEEELQYRETTNEFAKKIAQTMGLSPLKVENLLRSYTGTLGSYVLDVADVTTRLLTGESVIPPNFDNIPFIKRVFRVGDRSQGGLQQQFYELRNEVDTVVQSMNALRKQNRTDEYYAYANTMKGVVGITNQVRALERYMANWRRQRDRVLSRDDLSTTAKADLLEQLESQRDKRLAIVPILRQQADIPSLFRI